MRPCNITPVALCAMNKNKIQQNEGNVRMFTVFVKSMLKLTLAGGEKRNEVFIHSLELGHTAGTRAIKAMGEFSLSPSTHFTKAISAIP